MHRYIRILGWENIIEIPRGSPAATLKFKSDSGRVGSIRLKGRKLNKQVHHSFLGSTWICLHVCVPGYLEKFELWGRRLWLSDLTSIWIFCVRIMNQWNPPFWGSFVRTWFLVYTHKPISESLLGRDFGIHLKSLDYRYNSRAWWGVGWMHQSIFLLEDIYLFIYAYF